MLVNTYGASQERFTSVYKLWFFKKGWTAYLLLNALDSSLCRSLDARSVNFDKAFLGRLESSLLRCYVQCGLVLFPTFLATLARLCRSSL